jgi:hypothetical protein
MGLQDTQNECPKRMAPHTLAPIARQSKSEMSPFAAQWPSGPLSQLGRRLSGNGKFEADPVDWLKLQATF